MKKFILTIVLIICIINIIMMLIDLEIYAEKKTVTESCKYTGVTLLEYGVGVTNCGDTILIKMPGDLYKEYKLKNKQP